MKTIDPIKVSKSLEPTLKDKFKQFWNKKEGKVIVSSIVAVLLVCGIAFGIKYDQDKTQNNSKSLATSSLASIKINAESLEFGAPLMLEDQNGNLKQIQNGQTAELEAGKYTVTSMVDAGNGKAKGIKEEFLVNPKENKKIDVKVKEITLDESKSSAKSLPKPSKIEILKGIEAKTVEAPISDQGGSSDVREFVVQYPKLIFSPNQNGGDKVELGKPVAILQPQTTTTNLIKDDKQQNSSNGAELSNIPKAQRSSLAVLSSGEQKSLAQDCLIGKVNFNQAGTLLRYFKVCDDGQNGFYQYDTATKNQTQVLPSLDYSNVLKIVTSPVSDLMAWTKPDLGQFGIIQNGQFEVIAANVFYTYPYFSPDGKYLIVMDNYMANLNPKQVADLKLSDSDADQFGLKVRIVAVEDLLKNKDKADFKEIGTTYYLPRQIDYSLDFIHFTDSTHFMAGDSSKIFSLTGEPANTDLVLDLPGRVFQTNTGQKYRLHSGQLFNQKGRLLASNVEQIIEMQDKSLYFTSGSFVFRIVDSVAVQVYDKAIAFISASENILQLVQTDGQVVTFTF